MVAGKNQHFVPRSYFKHFSKDNITICLLNLDNMKTISNATIKGQCSKDYFYSKDTRIETEFSKLERMSNRVISRIIKEGDISFLTSQEFQNFKSHVLFQYGRTEYAKEAEEESSNALLDIFKPNIIAKAQSEGKDIKYLDKFKIKVNGAETLFISMVSGMLLLDMDMVLLENKTKTDFIFSDNPVVFFNSYFNNSMKTGTNGIASTGLQIYYPLNSKFSLFIYDPQFYDLGNGTKIRIKEEKDIKALNGLQIVFCNNTLYFEDINEENKILKRYKELKSKRTGRKTETEICGVRVLPDGRTTQIIRTSSKKIKYNLKKLSFLSHKNVDLAYGIRNKQLLDFNEKLMKGIKDKKIQSPEDIEHYFEDTQ